MNYKEFAALLDGNQYGNEITREQERIAADNGLVVVFGYSDDCVELRGAFDDELGAWDGTTFWVTQDGVLHTPDCGEEKCKYFEAAKRAAKSITAKWDDGDGPAWTIETDIPHETFNIYDDEEVFSVGIVFSTEDL